MTLKSSKGERLFLLQLKIGFKVERSKSGVIEQGGRLQVIKIRKFCESRICRLTR